MVFLSVYYFVILILFSIKENKFGIAHDTKLQSENKTETIKLNDGNIKTLFPIDAADLLECSKHDKYILLDKTNQLNKNGTHTNKLLPLESVYLSSHFFGIMESIAGTSGNFVNDAISGLQINRVVQVLKETRIQLYLGNFQDSPNIMPKKLSSINLSCIYGNYFPSLSFYHVNNFCEFTQGINHDYLLLSEDHICNHKYSEKYMYGSTMKYFNVLASLNIPILNYKEFDQQFLSLFNTQNFYYDQQAHLNRYLLLSNELGLSLFINFGIGFFAKLENEKYYLLVKIVPPDTFWIKDEYNEKQGNNNSRNKVINSQLCSKYENGSKFFNKNTVSIIETDRKNNHLAINRNSITYLNISLNGMIQCLGKYSINIYTKSDREKSLMFKIFDKEKHEFSDMEMIENMGKNKREFKYSYIFGNNYKLLSRINIMIINEEPNNTYIDYNISCRDNRIVVNNLFSYTWYVFKKKVLWNRDLEISLYSTKLTNHSNGIIFTIVILSLLISAPILGLFAVVIKSIIKRYDNSRINHLKIPLTINTHTKFENTYQAEKHSKYNLGENYLTKTLEIPLRLKKKFLSPSSSPASLQIHMNDREYNQLQSPVQLELYTAVSHNISETFKCNTDTCSSPSTIKSITFKH
ncbi:uncharacterized protein cubi_01915 [Cryptosporidium ubiquitum]|uniref:Uncharacterized protein n=1 Tax=Cryptosporidium ubiquitum TaxID=857276 RepID=A0A1J4MM97_9CRYT|nr:uncharacterized protein cubi_01915 [Cryptosporidium ubiquitum]OII75394.1 hypothetical protein cubi_01915 [Cryptosporidium ubiquitum]